MTLSQRQVFELCEQFAALHDGNLDETAAEELEQRILKDRDARRLYVRYMRVCAGLDWDFGVGDHVDREDAELAIEQTGGPSASALAALPIVDLNAASPIPSWTTGAPPTGIGPPASPVLGFLGGILRGDIHLPGSGATLWMVLALLSCTLTLGLACVLAIHGVNVQPGGRGCAAWECPVRPFPIGFGRVTGRHPLGLTRGGRGRCCPLDPHCRKRRGILRTHAGVRHNLRRRSGGQSLLGRHRTCIQYWSSHRCSRPG